MFMYSQEVNNILELIYDFPWSNVGRLTFLVSTHSSFSLLRRSRILVII